MKSKDELQQLRDELATKYANTYFNPKVEDEEWQLDFETFQSGFDAAVSIMQAEIDELKAENETLRGPLLEQEFLTPLEYEQQKEIKLLKEELKQKNENGCCIVEHGYRMNAEHELAALKADTEMLVEVLDVIAEDHFAGVWEIKKVAKDCLKQWNERQNK